MIDENKIYRGMKTCLDRRVDDKMERENMRDPLIAYTRAFYDALGWFEQNLWHGMNEEPEFGKDILVCDGKDILVSKWSGRNVAISFTKGNKFLRNWKEFAAYYSRIQRWCYISDLLPVKLIRPIEQ